jgi:hypothetical protein
MGGPSGRSLLFFVEESRESRHGFYDLLMSSHRLGNGYEFEMQPFERLTMLLNAYFFVTDQARFECMRRLGWLDTIPRADRSIIDVVMDTATFEYASFLETPPPTPLHPGYAEDAESRGIDRATLVRKQTVEAIRVFKERVGSDRSQVQRQATQREKTRHLTPATNRSYAVHRSKSHTDAVRQMKKRRSRVFSEGHCCSLAPNRRVGRDVEISRIRRAMNTFGFAQGLFYGCDHVGGVRLGVDQVAHQICPRRIPWLAIVWEGAGVTVNPCLPIRHQGATLILL